MNLLYNPEEGENHCFCLGIEQQPLQPRQIPDPSVPSLAEEFQKLSVQDREKVMEELHGVIDNVEETPEFLAECLKKMRQEIELIPQHRRRSYERAIFLCPRLPFDDKFHLIFLRGERYDARKAAEKFCIHFENKRELFPEEKLPCRITLDDLDEEDLACIIRGSFHPLPDKDQAGRTVVIVNLCQSQHTNGWKHVARCMYYQYFMMVEDEEVQRKGVVDVVYCVGLATFPTTLVNTLRKGNHVTSEFSIRHCAWHICYDNPHLHAMFSFFHRVTPEQTKARERYHFGSHLECSYSLRSFGVRLDPIPTPPMMNKYLDERRKMEEDWRREKAEKEKTMEFLPYPEKFDILVGRGKPYQNFPGNQRLAAIIKVCAQDYGQKDDRIEKTVLSMEIVRTVQKKGSRFVERVAEKGWRIVSDEAARAKVVQALRGKARSRKLNEEDEDITSKRRRVAHIKAEL